MLAMTLATEQHLTYFERIEHQFNLTPSHKEQGLYIERFEENNAIVLTLNRKEDGDVRPRFRKEFSKHRPVKIPHDENFFNEIQRVSGKKTWQGY